MPGQPGARPRSGRRCRPGRTSPARGAAATRSLRSTSHAEGRQVAQPGAGVDEVLVVAGDEEDALSRLTRSRQRARRPRAARRHLAVHQVTDDRDDVRALRVDHLDQPLEPASAVGGRQVAVGEGDDPVAVQRRVQAGERDRHPAHHRRRVRRPHPVAGRADGGHARGHRQRPGEEQRRDTSHRLGGSGSLAGAPVRGSGCGAASGPAALHRTQHPAHRLEHQQRQEGVERHPEPGVAHPVQRCLHRQRQRPPPQHRRDRQHGQDHGEHRQPGAAPARAGWCCARAGTTASCAAAPSPA